MDLIRLVAPTTSRERHKEILSQCSGFVYAVSIKGVTGQIPAGGTQVPGEPDPGIHRSPVCMDSGISTAQQVEELHTFADGVIVGSFLMDRIMIAEDPVKAAYETVKELLNSKER